MRTPCRHRLCPALGAPSPRRSDPLVDVLWISRQPRYRSCFVEYPSDLLTLCAGIDATCHWSWGSKR